MHFLKIRRRRFPSRIECPIPSWKDILEVAATKRQSPRSWRYVRKQLVASWEESTFRDIHNRRKFVGSRYRSTLRALFSYQDDVVKLPHREGRGQIQSINLQGRGTLILTCTPENGQRKEMFIRAKTNGKLRWNWDKFNCRHFLKFKVPFDVIKMTYFRTIIAPLILELVPQIPTDVVFHIIAQYYGSETTKSSKRRRKN